MAVDKQGPLVCSPKLKAKRNVLDRRKNGQFALPLNKVPYAMPSKIKPCLGSGVMSAFTLGS